MSQFILPLLLLIIITLSHGAELNSNLKQFVEEQRLTSLSVCTFNRERPSIVERYYGHQNAPTNNVLLSEKSVQPLASISKTFIWVSIALLRQNEVIKSFDDDVNDVIRVKNVSLRHPLHPDVPLTWRMFAEHTTGMARDILNHPNQSFAFGKDFPYTMDEVVLSLYNKREVRPGSGIIFRTLWRTGSCSQGAFDTKETCEGNAGVWTEGADVAKPGTVFAYSNIGSHVAAWLVSQAAKMPYERFVARNILEPLGMTNTHILHGNWVSNLTNPVWYDEDGKLRWAMEEAGNTNREAFITSADWASGFVYSSVHDMCRFFFTVTVARGFNPEGEAFLSTEIVNEMMTPRVIPTLDKGQRTMGFGFQINNDRFGFTAFGHGGAMPGVATDAWFVPQTRSGFLSFGTRNVEDNELVFQILRRGNIASLLGYLILFFVIVLLASLYFFCVVVTINRNKNRRSHI